MKVTIFCEKQEGWSKRLNRYMKIYQECCVENLQADWIGGRRELLERLAECACGIIAVPPEVLAGSYADFAQIMDAICQGKGKKKRMYMWTFRNNTVFLEEEEIAYLYTRKRRTYVSDGEREYQIRGGIRKEEKKLPKERFVRIHRNCLVNLAYIKAVQGSYAVLRNGKEMDISIRRRKETAERLMQYMSKSAENESAEKACESAGSLAKGRVIC